MTDKSICIDGGACHMATVSDRVPACTKGCGISRAKASFNWSRITALAADGFGPCARVVARANAQPN